MSIKKILNKLRIEKPIYIVKEVMFDGDNLEYMKIAKIHKGDKSMLDYETFLDEAKELLGNARDQPELKYFFSELSMDDLIKVMKYIDEVNSPERR